MPVAGNGPSDPLLALLDALPDGVIVTDAAAPHRVLWVSDAYLAAHRRDARRDARPRARRALLARGVEPSAFERLLAARRARRDGRRAPARARTATGAWSRSPSGSSGCPRRTAGPRSPGSRGSRSTAPSLASTRRSTATCSTQQGERRARSHVSPLRGADRHDVRLARPIDAWRARIHPDDRALVHDGRARLLAGHPLEREYRLSCADGKERVVLDRANPSEPEDGMVTVDGILIDVTARRQAALAFAETSSRLAHVIESIDEYIYTDVAGVEGHLGSPLYASPGIFRTLGRSVPLERLNEEWEAAVHPDDLATFRASQQAHGERRGHRGRVPRRAARRRGPLGVRSRPPAAHARRAHADRRRDRRHHRAPARRGRARRGARRGRSPEPGRCAHRASSTAGTSPRRSPPSSIAPRGGMPRSAC